MPALLDLRRSAAAFVAVAMSAALIVFVFIVSDSVRTRITESARASVGDADVVVLADHKDDAAGGRISERAVQQVSAADGVASVRPYVEGGVLAGRQGAAQESSLLVLDVPALTGSTRLVEGRLPQADNEIAVSPAVLERQQNVKVGNALTVRASEDASSTTVNVVGVVRPGADVTRYDAEDTPYIFATGQAQAAMGLPDDPAVLYVTGKAGTSDKELLSSVTEALATAQPGAQAYTASEIVTMRAKSSDGAASRTITLLQIIAPVCVVVSGIVIATTFTTLMARQTRQIGLLRCVGATRRQVVGSVLRTALLTGLAGSVAGAAVGAAVAVAAAMSSGLSSVASSMQTYISHYTPVDITVGELSAGQDPSSTVARIATVDGVEGVVPVPQLKVTMTGGRQKNQEEVLTVSAVDAKKVSPVLRSRKALEALDDRVLLLDHTYDIADGTPVTLTGPAGSVDLTVQVKEGLDAAVTPAVADRLVGNAPTASLLWVRADGDGSDRAPVSAVREAVAGSGLSVGDSQEGRTNLTDQVRQVSIAIGAMLVFTLLIALSGLANTIDVSVLERTREIGVLRATGTQRSGIRRLLITEAVLTALLGGTIGILLGYGVGIAGAAALLTTDSTSLLTVPVPWLALILVGILLMAAAVGVLASLRPAESASRIPPVHALAQD